LLTAEQRMRVLGSSSNFEKILVVNSSGNFWNLSVNLVDLLNVNSWLWLCWAVMNLFIFFSLV
jgi:hypothetical protein